MSRYIHVSHSRHIIIIIIIIIVGIQPLGQSGQRPELSQANGMALVRCILDKILGVVCHWFPPPLDVPNFATRCPHVRHDARDPSGRRWNWERMVSGNFAEMTTSTPFRDLLRAANLRHGTDGFTSPPKEGVLRIFFALKNPTASAGFKPANLGTKGQHATPRPPKPLNRHINTLYNLKKWIFEYMIIRLLYWKRTKFCVKVQLRYN
jgi:hypothetical protein